MSSHTVCSMFTDSQYLHNDVHIQTADSAFISNHTQSSERLSHLRAQCVAHYGPYLDEDQQVAPIRKLRVKNHLIVSILV